MASKRYRARHNNHLALNEICGFTKTWEKTQARITSWLNIEVLELESLGSNSGSY